MPAHARRSYFAVRAFNVEIASIKDGNEQIRRRRAGEGSSIALRMRMQWWRDALGQLYPIGDCDATTETPATNVFAPACWHNPVVRALHVAVEESDLTRRFLERLLDARDADLEIQQMATLEDAKMYAEDTWASLLYLSLECTGVSTVLVGKDWKNAIKN
jgi:NADH dehydrogenase [ubiquinone] 1 alpha subcomplex assembly factor 6